MVRVHISTLLVIVLCAPLAGALINGLLGRHLTRRTVSLVGVGSVFVAFAAALMAAWGWSGTQSTGGALGVVSSTLFEWIRSGPVRVDATLYLDALSRVMMLVVTGVGAFIHLYSVGYMAHDPGYARYFCYLNLFMFSMLLLVLSQNLLLLFVGWEGVGLCSYLLIGFWFEDMDKARAGKKAFVVNRIGDAGFLLALFVLVFLMHGSLDVPQLRVMVTEPGSPLAGGTLVTLVTLALFVGAMGKSAQIPLYVWLPDAMAGPTPVSALIHAATMVTAGVYMVARLSFLFALAPVTLGVIALVGGVTALFAASVALVQTDLKKVLAFSTVSQLGYMFLGLGVGAFGSGVFHLTTHAFFKAGLFLGAGSVIHALSGEQDIRRMGGLGRTLPVTRATFLIASLALAGVPPLAGFFSKDEILFHVASMRHLSGTWPEWMFWVLLVLGLATAAMTAFYTFRLYFLVFCGPSRLAPGLHPHESPRVMTLPLVILAVGALFGGALGLPGESVNVMGRTLAPVFASAAPWFASTGSHALEYALMGVSALLALGGIGLAARQYLRRGLGIAEPVGRWAGLHATLTHQYYVNEAYGALFVRPLASVSQWVRRWLDEGAIDSGMVHGPVRLVQALGALLRRPVTGDVQASVAAILLGLALLAWWML